MSPDMIWPLTRPFLVMAVMMLAMWEPKKKQKKDRKQSKKREEAWLDAEYEQI